MIFANSLCKVCNRFIFDPVTNYQAGSFSIYCTNVFDVFSSSREVKTAASLLSNVAFGFGVKVMALYEGQGVGLQWSNLATSPSLDDPFSMGIVFMMFILDTFIYLLITW